jgi:hypothetical protein
MDDATRSQMEGFWKLYAKLENSIDLENPDVYKAVMEMRTALSAQLMQIAQNREMKKTFLESVPLLFLSHYLGCDEDRLRVMNALEDSFLVSGEVTYV